MKRVTKTIGLLDAIAKINVPQCELLLLRSCAGISRLYFTMRTCPPRVFELATLPFAFGGFGVYSTGDVLNYAFFASRLQSAGLQTKLLRHTACSRVFAGDIYGDHAVSCAMIIGIKHRHNVVRDTLVDICYRSRISAGLDVCVDLTGSSPLMQIGMVDFVPGQAVIDVAQRKRGKYMAKCAANGYGFLLFSFSSLRELEADAVTLLKRIQKFSVASDIGARGDVHIFDRIDFAIAKGVRVHIVSWLPSNLL
nr:hypothetical protein [Tanacetum cinerariifolium]